MNDDGVVTISDVWLWLHWLYFYPGDFVLASFEATPIGTFFEVTPSSFGGWASGVISAIVWIFVFFIVVDILSSYGSPAAPPPSQD